MFRSISKKLKTALLTLEDSILDSNFKEHELMGDIVKETFSNLNPLKEESNKNYLIRTTAVVFVNYIQKVYGNEHFISISNLEPWILLQVESLDTRVIEEVQCVISILKEHKDVKVSQLRPSGMYVEFLYKEDGGVHICNNFTDPTLAVPWNSGILKILDVIEKTSKGDKVKSQMEQAVVVNKLETVEDILPYSIREELIREKEELTTDFIFDNEYADRDLLQVIYLDNLEDEVDLEGLMPCFLSNEGTACFLVGVFNKYLNVYYGLRYKLNITYEEGKVSIHSKQPDETLALELASIIKVLLHYTTVYLCNELPSGRIVVARCVGWDSTTNLITPLR